jgi:molybdopterin-guanine dinucleotide biosynthesis protein A
MQPVISRAGVAAYDAVVLAGGAGRRLGGVDKAALEVGSQPLLDGVLDAVGEATHVIVVGPSRALPSGVVGTSEQPAGGGPVAALAAGLDLVSAPLVVVLACDLPFLTRSTVTDLVGVLDRGGDYDGAQLVDEGGRRQPLAAVYRTDVLGQARRALPQVAGSPMRAVVEGMSMLDVEALPGVAWDCDTWADVERARQRADKTPLEEA